VRFPRTVALLVALVLARPAAANQHLIALDEVLASFQGDTSLQFIELRLLAPGQQSLSNGGGVRGAADLVFDDAAGTPEGRRVFTFTHDLAQGAAGARVLIATAGLATLAGVPADFVLPTGVLAPGAGRVCYRVNPPQDPVQPTGIIDCVAYGKFTGDTGRFGPPTPITPENRSLQRVGTSGMTVTDWTGELQPTPENNAGVGAILPTLCGDGAISQGEECDGDALGGASCATLGFASGALACQQCHFDTTACSFCGNGAINGAEECDGTALGGRTCESLGFTGGSLACTDQCRLSTRGCDPTFFVPGGGPRGPECLAEWRVENAAGRPGGDGKAPAKQRCQDGDSGCDADAVAGTCTFTIALCFDRTDARLAVGARPCRREAIESWTLRVPSAGIAPLVAGVGTLGASTAVGNAVTFSPPLEAREHCTDAVAVTVPTRGKRPGKLVLKTLTVAAAGHPRDSDSLKLVCSP
jgi:hypothetical protein